MKVSTYLMIVAVLFTACGKEKSNLREIEKENGVANSNDTTIISPPVDPPVLPPQEYYEHHHWLSTGYCGNVAPFIEGVSMYLRNDSVYVIKGIALDTYQYGRNIKLVEDLKGNFPKEINTFIAWGSGFGPIESARIGNLSEHYDNQDVLIMILTNYDYRFAKFWKDLRYEEILGVPFFEKPEDFRTIGCTHAVLKLKDDIVTGSISRKDHVMFWDEFYKILQEALIKP